MTIYCNCITYVHIINGDEYNNNIYTSQRVATANVFFALFSFSITLLLCLLLIVECVQ